MTDDVTTDLMARALAENEAKAAEARATLAQTDADRAQLLAAEADARAARTAANQWADDVRRAEYHAAQRQRAVLHWQHHLAMVAPARAIVDLYDRCMTGDARDSAQPIEYGAATAVPALRSLLLKADLYTKERDRMQAELTAARAHLAEVKRAGPEV